jgi:hypothetical protein
MQVKCEMKARTACYIKQKIKLAWKEDLSYMYEQITMKQDNLNFKECFRK